jgi:hypothetical protein
LPRRRRIFPKSSRSSLSWSPVRNEEVPTPTACTVVRFRSGACHLAGSRSEDGGGHDPLGVIPHSHSKRSRRACPVHHPCEEDGLLESQRLVTSHPLATGPGAPARFTFPTATIRQLEPSVLSV